MKSPPLPMVSIIIIDYKNHNPYLVECLESIQKLTYQNYEILLLTDYQHELKYPKLKTKSYGRYMHPAHKRDDGAKLAKGELLAFIDDDAHPLPYWLDEVVKAFDDPEVAAVGGPGVTPPQVPWQETASGWASASPLGAGFYNYRFMPTRRQYVDDYPSMNLTVRKSDFLKVKGFDSSFWPGEDTKICLDLVYKLGKKIVYEPKALVYHHRRPLWIPHLRQNGNFGLHRGYFAKVLPQTSLRLIYFGPSILVLGLTYIFVTYGMSNPWLQLIRELGIYLFLLYLTVLGLNGMWVAVYSGSLLQGLISMPAVFLTHIWYGTKFLQGLLFTKELKR